MITKKKILGGGDKVVENMIDNSAVLGIDIVELIWTKNTPTNSVHQIIGFKFPIMDNPNAVVDIDNPSATWIEGTLHFYPDGKGNAWGYVYDVPENREFLYNSFNNGWYRIVDKKIREEIFEEAKNKGINVESAKKTDIMIKKSKREKEAEDHIKALERKLSEQQEKMQSLMQELQVTKGEKVSFVERRLKGVKIPDREKAIENIKGSD